MGAYVLDAPIDLNDFTRVCGHFTWGATLSHPAGDDYCCTHPENDDPQGRCFSFSCPLAWTLTPGEPDDRPYFDAIGIGEEDEAGETDWMVPYRLPLDDELAGDLARWEDDGGSCREEV